MAPSSFHCGDRGEAHRRFDPRQTINATNKKGFTAALIKSASSMSVTSRAMRSSIANGAFNVATSS
jgi:hypothetical protein